MPNEAETQHLFDAEQRDQFIPVRKIDILNALIASGRLPGEQAQESFRRLCQVLGAVFHYEYFETLEALRDDYYYFNPEMDVNGRFDAETRERARADLGEKLGAVLSGANYVPVPLDVVTKTATGGRFVRVEVDTPMEDYSEVTFFRRGHHKETTVVRRWFGLRKETQESWVFDNVLLTVVIKGDHEIKTKGQRKRLESSHFRPGSILIKHFRNIAPGDLKMLLPRVRVVMSLFDKLTIAVPALAGAVPLIINLLPLLTVLFLVGGFYLGVNSSVRHEEVLKAFVALTFVAGLGGLVMRQRLKYERLSLKYQKEISDHFYFRNVSNNAGIFDYIVGTAEEQECKEAFLAYYFLLTADAPPDQNTLDARIEKWLAETFHIDVDFEVDDALKKLERLGLLRRDDSGLGVAPLDEALVVLDNRWDNIFQYANRADAAPRKGRGLEPVT
jgi:hypothetical protein